MLNYQNSDATSTDRAAGRWPAEWEPHSRTLISWPVADALVWPENLDDVRAGYAAVVRAVGEFEPVLLLVNSGDLPLARDLCGSGVEYVEIPHDDAWLRDNGPTFVREPSGALRGVSWRFNAWGGKWPHQRDAQAAAAICEYLRIPCQGADIVLEGGSIHGDGQGTVLTTAQCLLHPTRNPGLQGEDLETALARHIGARRVIWLPDGLEGDHTDGHVDNVACFAAPGVVLMQTCDDPGDANSVGTRRNRAALADARDAAGRRPQVAEIVQPPRREHHGDRLALSYLNFYLVNGGVIAPVFGGDAAGRDDAALGTLREMFPGRRVIPVDGMPLVREGGNVHCITQQVPQAL